MVKCTSFSIQRKFGGKKKSAIVGTVSNASWWGKEVVLGLFDTKEIAQNELTRLQTELISNTEIYEMSLLITVTDKRDVSQHYIKTMHKSVSIRKSMLACSANCPADNQARQLAQFLYEKL